MELLLFPAMTVSAGLESLASFFVAGNEGSTLPVFTELSVIPKEIWLSSEVLEVMRVNALRLIVVMVVRAPLGLEVKNEEIII
jgi:hypothetical protein